MRTAACLPLLTVLAAVSPAAAQLAPLQASVATQVAGDAGASRELFATLDGGMARVHARITNRDDGRTATVTLRFTYEVPLGTIALDEIVDRIAVAVRTAAGERFSRASVDPHEINLNPNSSSLAYRLTLYRPAGAYRVRIRVFGNYE